MVSHGSDPLNLFQSTGNTDKIVHFFFFAVLGMGLEMQAHHAIVSVFPYLFKRYMFLLNFISACVSAWGYVHMCAGVCGGQMKGSDPLSMEL